MDIFEPFIHDGSVSLSSDMSDCTPIKILRDTGASQSLPLSDTLSFSEESSAGVSVLIKRVNCSEYTPVPLHTVYLSSNLVSGPVEVGVQSSLPFEGVQLILGNDLAGEKVIVNAIVTDKPYLEQCPDPVEKAIPGLYPACVVTRAMSKKKEGTEEEVTLADTIIGEALKNKPSRTLVPEPAVVVTEDGLAYQADKMSTPHLIAEQQRDPIVASLFARVVDESEVSKNPLYKERSADEKVEAT